MLEDFLAGTKLGRMKLLLFCFALVSATVCRAAADTAYLFTYFIDNGQDGLHLMASHDGLKWEVLGGGKSYLTPTVGSKEKLMRDPCVVRGPDGVYHMVWTSGWWERGIGYASTRDFITWTTPKEIPVMAYARDARNAWAPEIVYDEKAKVFVIYWSATVPSERKPGALTAEDGLDHRIYATTTSDFATFTPTRVLYDPGFPCIDATLVKFKDQWHWIIKDETRHPEPRKHLQVATAQTVQGPFGPLGSPFTPPGLWVEGPTAQPIGDAVYVFYDVYITKRYGVMRTRDFVTWEDLSDQLQMPEDGSPKRPRHGTIIEIPLALAKALGMSPPKSD